MEIEIQKEQTSVEWHALRSLVLIFINNLYICLKIYDSN